MALAGKNHGAAQPRKIHTNSRRPWALHEPQPMQRPGIAYNT